MVLALSLGAGIGLAPASAAGAETSAQDSFARPNGPGWGATDSGTRWMYPEGKSGFAIVQRDGAIRHPHAATPKLATLNVRLRDTTAMFTLALGGGSAGPSPKAVALLRRSAAGEYRLGVRVGEGGKVWLSISKSRAGGTAKGLGKSVVVSGLRYRPGDELKVAAQAIKRNPTQLRMKVWKAGTEMPSKWQIVRNDGRNDIEAGGRVGLMSLPTGKPKATVGLLYDDVVVRPARRATRVPVGSFGSSPAPKSDAKTKTAPKATPKPAPKATPKPTPKATPKPTPKPTAPPSSSKIVKVPSSIDSTGSKDVSAQLQSFIGQSPNGSTIVFKAGGVYRIGKALSVWTKRNVTLDGNGATLRNPAAGRMPQSHIIVQRDSVNTTIRDFTLVGGNSQAGTSGAYVSGHEGQHAITIAGAADTLIEDVTIRRTYGDCVYVGAAYGTLAWSDGVTFRDSTCQLTGRMGVTIIAGKNVLVERVAFDKIGLGVFAMEPNTSSDGANNVTLRNNTVGTYGLTNKWYAYLFFASGAQGSSVRNVTFHNNVVQGNPRGGRDGKPQGLDIIVNGDRGPRSNFRITNNVSKTADGGPTMTFRSVKGVVVTGNKQPLTKGELATFPGSTSVTYDG